MSMVTHAQEALLLMGYDLSGSVCNKYEEGSYGASVLNIDSVTCFAFYFRGAMMATPLYRHQIKEIEYVMQTDSSQIDKIYSSQTGRIYYGKSKNGTYFAEKFFYKDLDGLPQGIILYNIPANYYEEVLVKLVSLPQLPSELLYILQK